MALAMYTAARMAYSRGVGNSDEGIEMAIIESLKDGEGRFEAALRWTLDRVGLDPYDVRLAALRAFCRATEKAPVSRFRFGSPCRFVRAIDFTVHVWLAEALAERHARVSLALQGTSPRWGRRQNATANELGIEITLEEVGP